MIKTALSLCLLLSATVAFGQTKLDTPATKPAGVTSVPVVLSESMFKSVLFRQFSYIQNGDNKSKAGNFASVDLTKPAATLNASSLNAKGVIFTINAAAAVKDGLGSLFNNSKLNNDVSIEGKVSFMQHI